MVLVSIPASPSGSCTPFKFITIYALFAAVLGAHGERGVNVTIVFPPDTASVPATSALPFGVYCVAYTLPLFIVCGLIGPLKVNMTGVVNVAIVAPYAG